MTKKQLSKVTKLAGESIRATRKAQGLTLVKLANKVGVSFQVMQRHEAGTSGMALTRFCNIMYALKVSPVAELALLLKEARK